MEVQVHHLKSGSSWKSCHNGKCSLFREPRKVKESSAVICKAFMGQSYPCCDSQAFWPARGIHPERKSLHIISLDLLSTVWSPIALLQWIGCRRLPWKQCDRCSDRADRGGTSRPPPSSPSPARHTLAWSWPSLLLNILIGKEPTCGSATWRGRCGGRRRCREPAGRRPRERWVPPGWASRTRGRCRSSRWRCWSAGCRGRRASQAPPTSQICEMCTLSIWRQERGKSTLSVWEQIFFTRDESLVTWGKCKPSGRSCLPGRGQQRIKPEYLISKRPAHVVHMEAHRS